MYKAVFTFKAGVVDPQIAKILLPVPLLDRLISEVDNLNAGEGLTVGLDQQVVDAKGNAISATLEWMPATHAFNLSINGESVGLILRDELAGGLKVTGSFGRKASPGLVSFDVGGMRCWRKALVDFDTGEVAVLTATEWTKVSQCRLLVSPGFGADLNHVAVLDLGQGREGRHKLSSEQLSWLVGSLTKKKRSNISLEKLSELRAMREDVLSFLFDGVNQAA